MVVAGTGTWRMLTGFEAQSPDLIQTSTGAVQFVAAGQRSGGAAASLAANTTPNVFSLPMSWVNSTNARTIIAAGDSHIIVLFGLRNTDVTPTGLRTLAECLNDNGAAIWTLELEGDGDIVFRDRIGTALVTVTNPLTDDDWFLFEILFEHVASGDWELRIDGNTEGSGSTGDFDDGTFDPDLIQFTGVDTDTNGVTGDFMRIDDYGVKTHTSIAITFPSDDAASPFFEILGFQAGDGSTQAGTWNIGGPTDFDDIPPSDAGFAELNSNASEVNNDTDAGGSAENGPSGNASINEVHGPVGLYHQRLGRTNGSSPDSLDQATGDDAALSYNDRAAALSTAANPFFTVESTNAPDETEFGTYGVRKQGSGGRDIDQYFGIVEVANAPAADVADPPTEWAATQAIAPYPSAYLRPVGVVAGSPGGAGV